MFSEFFFNRINLTDFFFNLNLFKYKLSPLPFFFMIEFCFFFILLKQWIKQEIKILIGGESLIIKS